MNRSSVRFRQAAQRNALDSVGGVLASGLRCGGAAVGVPVMASRGQALSVGVPVGTLALSGCAADLPLSVVEGSTVSVGWRGLVERIHIPAMVEMPLGTRKELDEGPSVPR